MITFVFCLDITLAGKWALRTKSINLLLLLMDFAKRCRSTLLTNRAFLLGWGGVEEGGGEGLTLRTSHYVHLPKTKTMGWKFAARGGAEPSTS